MSLACRPMPARLPRKLHRRHKAAHLNSPGRLPLAALIRLTPRADVMLHGTAAGTDLLTAAIATLVLIAITGALYTHRLGLSHLLVFMAVGMLTGVDGPLG